MPNKGDNFGKSPQFIHAELFLVSNELRDKSINYQRTKKEVTMVPIELSENDTLVPVLIQYIYIYIYVLQ